MDTPESSSEYLANKSTAEIAHNETQFINGVVDDDERIEANVSKCKPSYIACIMFQPDRIKTFHKMLSKIQRSLLQQNIAPSAMNNKQFISYNDYSCLLKTACGKFIPYLTSTSILKLQSINGVPNHVVNIKSLLDSISRKIWLQQNRITHSLYVYTSTLGSATLLQPEMLDRSRFLRMHGTRKDSLELREGGKNIKEHTRNELVFDAVDAQHLCSLLKNILIDNFSF